VDILIMCLAALAASLLTLFSGFGLGTLLMPVMALFMPLPTAIAVTAVVHLANNLFKGALLGTHADGRVLLRFGVPALLTSLLGAWLLQRIGQLPPWHEYMLAGRQFAIEPLKVVIGVLILIFVALESHPQMSRWALQPRLLPLGGMVSGFFGGLSGHQGALRSMFLLKSGLDKTAFIATGIVIAVLVDLARLVVYGIDLQTASDRWPLVLAATLAAMLGAIIGTRLLHKVTYRNVQNVVSGLLVIIATGLIGGII
jgi:uncharacterized membrane protein YfcA